MIGITLSSDQIRTAPAEVRRWIAREVMMSLGLQDTPAAAGAVSSADPETEAVQPDKEAGIAD